MLEVPNVISKCDGCLEDLNLLAPYLKLVIKAERQVLVTTTPTVNDGDTISDPDIYLGSQSGRGRILCLHNFACLKKYADERKDKDAVMEVHKEDGDPYVPEDNRSPEELVKAGEMTAEHSDLLKHLAENATVTINGREQ